MDAESVIRLRRVVLGLARQLNAASVGEGLTPAQASVLAVIVNRGTSGAAEVVAAALLDNGRGEVVGDKTFGEGSVQKLIEVVHDASHKVSREGIACQRTCRHGRD